MTPSIFVQTANRSIASMSDDEMEDVAMNVKENAASSQNIEIEVHDNDVLCGRGGDININPGNIKYRKTVETNKRVYLTSRFKREKRIIAERIVKDIKRQSPSGRFLTRDVKDGPWREISDEKARDKVSQALREGAPKLREKFEQQQKPLTKSPHPMHNKEQYYDAGYHNSVHESPDRRDEGYHYRGPHAMIHSFTESFGCSTHLRDVRDDDLHAGYHSHPHEREHHDYNQQHHNGNGWEQRQYGQSESKWDQRQYGQPSYRDDREPCPQSVYGADQHARMNNPHPRPHPQQRPPHVYGGEQGNRIDQPLDMNHPLPQQPGMWNSLRSVLSWGSDKHLSSSQPVDAPPSNNGMDCEPNHTTSESGAAFGARALNQRDEAPNSESWISSFTQCNVFNQFQACQSNLTETLNWTVYGDQPEGQITSIGSIEIDGPVSSEEMREMRGSTLINVFNDSSGAMSLNNDDVFNESELGFHKSFLQNSTFNLEDSALLEMNFSTDLP